MCNQTKKRKEEEEETRFVKIRKKREWKKKEQINSYTSYVD